ncbi:Rab3 GTPase-activating protein catalytic subunit-domain-containing protein [Sporodiniella umbellata]|nr:Rab3 GTPase-activating protein catalytic subunit-domain-containing protein [Sporodiniella umbellata]
MSVITPPSPLSCLDELRTLFMQKMKIQRADYGRAENSDSDVWTTAVYTYDLKNWFESSWKNWSEIENNPLNQARSSFAEDLDSLSRATEHLKRSSDDRKLPFGSFNDPLRSLTLSALFPFWKDGFYDDLQSTNMDAITAKRWILSREFAPRSQQRADLSTLIERIFNSWIKDPSNHEYLAPYDEDNEELSEHLQRGRYSATSSNTSESSVRMGDDQVTVVKSDQVEEVLSHLFSDSKDDDVSNDTLPNTKMLALKLKSNTSVPYKSFFWDLLFFTLEAIANNSTHGNTRRHNTSDYFGFLRIVWTEVLRKIRWHWENSKPIPKLNPFLYEADEKTNRTLGIDLRFNLLHQKLSMVNCCIHRKLQSKDNRENTKHRMTASIDLERKVFRSNASDDSDSTEEFFDTVEDADVSSNAVQPSLYGDVIEGPHTLTESYVRLPFVAQFNSEEADTAAIREADHFEGRLHEHREGLKLLRTNEPLFAPVTQDPGFMTEDMIREQAEAFENMGTSNRATLKRAQLQSQQLYSDMQAFKAANPHASLEDFVRWHSPRDWIVPEGKENKDGALSKRMSEPSNIWQELWNCSQRIPCSRQKPLFDLYSEAERAIKFLEALSVHEVFA